MLIQMLNEKIRKDSFQWQLFLFLLVFLSLMLGMEFIKNV